MMIKKTLYTGMFLVMLMISTQAQRIWFVRENGTGNKDGSSWENAAADLEETVQQASSSDTVWVAAGIYTGGFTMKDGVQVLGGFSGHESAAIYRKLPGSGQNLTILDGNNRFRVLTQAETFSQPTAWDGFIIRNGVANDGGGVYLRSNGILRRSVITGNTAGIPAIGDYMTSEGGVVFHVNSATKKASIIATANYGSNYQIGVAGNNPKNTLADAMLDMNGVNNTNALAAGRAVQVLKKYRAEAPAQIHEDWYIPSAGEWALFITDSEKNKNTQVFQKVEETLLQNNKTPLSGQRFWSSTPVVQNGMQGAWNINFATKELNATNIWQFNRIRGVRTAGYTIDTGKGGAIFATTGSKIEGCLIYNNISALGYAICARGEIDIVNSTIVGNVSQSASVNSYAVDGNASVRLLNSIVTGNLNAASNASNFYNGMIHLSSAIETTAVLPSGNIALGAVSQPNGAGFVDVSVHNYQLKESSICVSAGNTSLVPESLTTDLAGNLRIGTSGVSMGAFEPTTVSGTDNPTTGIVSIYPNPVKAGSYFNITLLNNAYNTDDIRVEIFNVIGVRYGIYSGDELNRIQSPAETGIYILRISESGKASNEQRFIVN